MNGKNRWGVWKELSNLRWERIQLTSHWACGNHVCYHCNEYCTISLRNVWQKCIDSRKWLTRTFLQVTACRNSGWDRGPLSMCMNCFRKLIPRKNLQTSSLQNHQNNDQFVLDLTFGSLCIARNTSLLASDSSQKKIGISGGPIW